MIENRAGIEQKIREHHQNGDQERALKLFIDAFQDRLYSLCYKMSGNYDDAMDAMQETLLQVNKSLGKFEGRSSLYTWAYRITVNICLNQRRRKQRHESHVHSDSDFVMSLVNPVARPIEDPDKMCEQGFQEYFLSKSIRKLPANQQAALILFEMEGMTSPEIGEALGIEAGAVKARLHRARENLQGILRDDASRVEKEYIKYERLTAAAGVG